MTPDQRQFRERLLNLDESFAHLNTLCDLAETKAAEVSGKTAWEPETALAYETAVLPQRRV